MRRTHLRTHAKILKRPLVHSAGHNLSLLMRTLFGVGKPRLLQDAAGAFGAAFAAALALLVRHLAALRLEPPPLPSLIAVLRPDTPRLAWRHPVA